jgi:hypothetical protein
MRRRQLPVLPAQAPQAPGGYRPIVTDLTPGTGPIPNPVPDGFEAIILTGSAAWTLRYTTTLARWIFVGGSGIYTFLATSETTNSNSAYVDLATPGPLINIPIAGTYVVQYGAQISTPPVANGAGMITVQAPGSSASDNNGIFLLQNTALNNQAHLSRTIQITATTPGQIKLVYRVAAAGGTATFQRRWINVTPLFIP